MQIDILTLFPEIFSSSFSASIIKRALDKKIANIRIINLRDFGEGKHKKVDDRPYGGGVGMILRVDIIDKSVRYAKEDDNKKNCRIILLDPKGKQFNQPIAKRLVNYKHLIFVCGHYEGVDDRVNKLVDENISIGPYILTGGELPAAVLTETIIRLLPGVLSKQKAISDESFSNNFLEYPQYTRPQVFKGYKVPKILLSGNHIKINQWRQTKKRLEKITNERKG